MLNLWWKAVIGTRVAAGHPPGRSISDFEAEDEILALTAYLVSLNGT